MSSISTLIHRMEYDPDTKGFNDLIREFSMQIVHQPIQFTTAEFCVLNYNMLGCVSLLLNIFNKA